MQFHPKAQSHSHPSPPVLKQCPPSYRSQPLGASHICLNVGADVGVSVGASVVGASVVGSFVGTDVVGAFDGASVVGAFDGASVGVPVGASLVGAAVISAHS